MGSGLIGGRKFWFLNLRLFRLASNHLLTWRILPYCRTKFVCWLRSNLGLRFRRLSPSNYILCKDILILRTFLIIPESETRQYLLPKRQVMLCPILPIQPLRFLITVGRFLRIPCRTSRHIGWFFLSICRPRNQFKWYHNEKGSLCPLKLMILLFSKGLIN